ncbi:DUF1659 domain-containing protein [Clostridium sp. YIM B02515]|uniref:DUF1659 domain-containing protein n=1 Tax=Clostridium rhizosphaerae TaxID=2803861 RepID=A0ABS1T6P3_9CLOT|nr:DUF1659 domain-containing protein [Clostridium rhizosphaerae]MBL4935013.1 DUF1659 domain-containing protein [Clostridium rhizosphaerae]
MAVVSTPVSSALSIKFKAGIDANGKDIIKAKKFSNVKVTAAPDKLLEIGTALGSLLKNEFVSVGRTDDSVLVNE